jgi:hypothetical protein
MFLMNSLLLYTVGSCHTFIQQSQTLTENADNVAKMLIKISSLVLLNNFLN